MICTLRNANRDIQVSVISSAGGGEGQCYRIDGMKGHSVKIYFDPVPADLESRLEHLIAKPPASILNQIAWPIDIVESGHCEVKGYLQQHFHAHYQSFTTLSSPLTRPRWATRTFVQRSVQQVSYLIAELHAYGYLFPDLHSEQFLTAKDGSVVLVDTASCQFIDAGTLYPCICVREDYQAPELLHGQSWADVAADRNQHTDAWSLAVLIFETLMGCHPFDGIYIGPDKALPRKDRIKQGFFPFEYRATHDYRPPKNAPPYRHLDRDVREFFHRCFVEGHAKDKAYRRPSAGEWSDVLRRSSQAPAAPSQFPTHQTLPLAIALRSVWDRAIQGTSSIQRQGLAIACAALLLLAVGIVSYCLATNRPNYPTVNRLRSATDSNTDPVQFDPSAPSVDSLLSRLRGRTNPKKELRK